MKRVSIIKRYVLLICTVVLVALSGLAVWIGVTPAYADDAADPAVSKTASPTTLDDSYETEITVTFPSEEVQLVTDVVFVVDDSDAHKPRVDECLRMLQELNDQVSASGAAVQVGAVMYRGNGTEKQFPLTTLDDDVADQLREFSSTRPSEKGSNMHAGLLAAQEMLANSSTPASRQYLILISDGNIYTWDEGGVQTGVSFTSGGKAHYASVETWGGYHSYPRWTPEEGWGAYLDGRADAIAKSEAEHATPYDRNNIQNPLTEAEERTGEYANSQEVAMHKARAVYQELADQYHCYAIGLEPYADYYGMSFMQYLGSIEGGESPDLTKIKNDILYLMSAGSVLHDVMGSGTDSEGNEYDFAFVDDASTITLKVGETNYGNPTDLGNGEFAFGEEGGSKDGSTYPYILRYNAAEDAYDLEINVDITNFERLSLTYKVRLTNPQEDPGTYQNLLTNNETTINPIDSAGNPGEPVTIESPVVEYEIKAPETIDITVSKTWDDAGDQDGIRPDSVTVRLLADGKDTGETLELEADSWSGTFEGLLKYNDDGEEIVYTVVEDAVEGYEASVSGSAAEGYVVTNTHEPATTSVPVQKAWDDADDQDGVRPASVTVRLLADGVDTGLALTLSEDNGWQGVFEGLPQHKAGKDIAYTVAEDAVDGYSTSYATEVVDGVTTFVVTNTHTPGQTSLTVTKVWDDADDQDGARPATVTVRLLADGVDTGQVAELSGVNGWEATFEGLDLRKGGQDISYAVVEDAVDGYSTSYATEVVDGVTTFVVTNTHTPGQTSLTVTKVWDDAGWAASRACRCARLAPASPTRWPRMPWQAMWRPSPATR